MSRYLNEITIFDKNKLKKSLIQITFPSGKTEFNQIDFHKGIIETSGIESTDNTFKTHGFIPLTKIDSTIGIINTYLSFGSQDSASNWDEIHTNGITHIINLCSDFIPNYFPENIVYLSLSLRDDENENLNYCLPKILEFINVMREESNSNRCLIHCNAGMSRSPSVAIAILMTLEHFAYDQAFSLVASTNRAHIQPNKNFINQLKNLFL